MDEEQVINQILEDEGLTSSLDETEATRLTNTLIEQAKVIVKQAKSEDEGWAQIKALRQGSGSGAGTNTTGFSAILGGYRHLTGVFSITGYQTYFWTSTGQSSTATHSLYLFYNYSDYYFNDIDKGYGVSIRCIRD